MKLFQLEDRPTDSKRISALLMTGLFGAVGILFMARWYVAADYQSLSVGDSVSSPTTPGNRNTLINIKGDIAVIEGPDGREHRVALSDVHEM